MSYAATPNRRKHWYHLLSIGQKKLIIICSVLAVLLLTVFTVLGVYGYRAMQFDLNQVSAGLNSSMLYDSANSPIASIAEDADSFVSRDDLPQNLVNAFVAREDENFFEHDGIVLTSVLRSVIRNIISMRYEQGASTITMQLTRNVFELSGKSMDRKMLEAMLALRIEHRFDKHTILEQYLSRIYYGQNCYGIKAAARHYFGKAVRDLDLVECATLAGLVRAPSLYNPVRSMDKARAVKNETLQRMLECEMITQEQFNEAAAAPIILKRGSVSAESGSSYAVMWTRRELDEMGSEVPEHSGGISVVSSLNLPLQQYVEQAVEKALTAVEQPGVYPEAWLAGMESEAAESTRAAFAKMRRPEGLKVRGENNDLKDLLQCCVLVVDARRNQRGKVLAMVGGRSAVDGRDRWQDKLRPGRAAAPFLFCCACMPGGDDMHIVARSTEITGRRLGYDVVRAFYDSLKLPVELPGREQELYLYNGLFQIRRVDLARLLFSLQNEGRGYRLSMVNTIWNSNRQMIYNYEPEKSPEYIRREGATAVSSLPPFHITEGEPVTMNETLPEGSGQWAMAFRPRSVCTFVWMGFDDATNPLASARELRPLLSRAASRLAREVFDKARAELRARQKAAATPQPAS
ncbi:MAG: transglycosylase domain-containing protein [Akkermansia sp.]|nr:transglycosylase domain-containing protein [Akkermansia sp.]MBQ8376010.1 transglycosylase domain-containing protein [Akkermansia sp.]